MMPNILHQISNKCQISLIFYDDVIQNWYFDIFYVKKIMKANSSIFYWKQLSRSVYKTAGFWFFFRSSQPLRRLGSYFLFLCILQIYYHSVFSIIWNIFIVVLIAEKILQLSLTKICLKSIGDEVDSHCCSIFVSCRCSPGASWNR